MVVIAVHPLRVHGDEVPLFADDGGLIQGGQGGAQVGDEAAELAADAGGVGAALPEDGDQLPHGAACAPAVDEVGEQLPRAGAVKADGLAPVEDGEVAKGLDPKLFGCLRRGVAQVGQLGGHLLVRDRVEQVAAGVEGEGLPKGVGVGRHEDEVRAGAAPVQRPGQGQAGAVGGKKDGVRRRTVPVQPGLQGLGGKEGVQLPRGTDPAEGRRQRRQARPVGFGGEDTHG